MGGTDTYEQFIRGFLSDMFPKGDVPLWTVDALGCAGFKVESTVTRDSEMTAPHTEEEDEGNGGDKGRGRGGDKDGPSDSCDTEDIDIAVESSSLKDAVLAKKRKGSENL